MTPTSSEFPEADRIVDELLDGRRVFLFWPGTGSVVSVIMLHVVGVALWVGPTFFAAVPWLRRQGWVWEPLLIVVLAVCLASVVIPAVLLTRGKPIGYVALRAVTASWIGAVGVTLAAVLLQWVTRPWWSYAISGVAFGLAYALQRSEGYRVYVLLRQRFFVRLRERSGG